MRTVGVENEEEMGQIADMFIMEYEELEKRLE